MNYLNENIIDLLEYLSVPAFVISLNNNRIVATNSRIDRKYPNLFVYGTKVELLDNPKILSQTRFVSYDFSAKKLVLSFQCKEDASFVLNYVNESTIIASEINTGITSTRTFQMQDFSDSENFCHYELTPYHFNYTYDFAFNKWQISNPDQLIENGLINSLAELDSFSWREHICEEDRAKYDLAMKTINLKGGNHEIHYSIVTPCGKLVQICDYCGVIKKDDGWPLIVGSIVSGERALEEIYQAQQDAMTGKLIGGMVHDFKNLLSGIHNVIEWASSVSQEKQIVDALHKTLDYTNQANYLISNTLKLNVNKKCENKTLNEVNKQINCDQFNSLKISQPHVAINENELNRKNSVGKFRNKKINDISKLSIEQSFARKNSSNLELKPKKRLNSLKGLFNNDALESKKEEFNTRTRSIALQPSSEKLHFNLGNLVINLSDLIVRMVPESIVVMVEVEENLPYIYGTRRELQNVLLNLCLNARDAMSEKGGELTIQLSSEKIANPLTGGFKNNIVLSVKDTGCGMAREQYEKVLQPYYSNKKTGSGLGLWMVKNTVDSLDGKLIIKSKPGLGSTFLIKIPAVDKSYVDDQKFFSSLGSTSPQIALPKKMNSQRTKKLNLKKFSETTSNINESKPSLIDEILQIVRKSPKKILYIEDNELIRYSTASYLRSLGLEVFEAEDGNQGEDIFAENSTEIDFVIQDYILPGKGGKELFTSLKSLNDTVPILICSANPDNDAMQSMLDNGACGLINKPFRFDDLLKYLVDHFETVGA